MKCWNATSYAVTAIVDIVVMREVDGIYVDQGRVSSRADTDSESGRPADTGVDSDGFLGHPVTVQQEFVYATEPTAAPPPRVVAGHAPVSAQPSRVTAQARAAVRTLFSCVSAKVRRNCCSYWDWCLVTVVVSEGYDNTIRREMLFFRSLRSWHKLASSTVWYQKLKSGKQKN